MLKINNFNNGKLLRIVLLTVIVLLSLTAAWAVLRDINTKPPSTHSTQSTPVISAEQQRLMNERNQLRKNDVTKLLASYLEYVNNNNGVAPASCTGATPCPFLGLVSTASYGIKGWNSDNFSFTNFADTKPVVDQLKKINDVDLSKIKAGTYLSCTIDGASATVAQTKRQVSFIFAIETPSGTATTCLSDS